MPAFRMATQSSRRRRAEPAGYGFLTVGRTARILRVASLAGSDGSYSHGHRWFNPAETEAALLRINTPPTL